MTHTSATPAILITMPHSHYAEKARWALDWLAMPYREEPHVPLLHRLATAAIGQEAGSGDAADQKQFGEARRFAHSASFR